MISEKVTYIVGITGLTSIFVIAAIYSKGFLWVIGIVVILIVLFLRVALKEIDREMEFLFLFLLLIIWGISVFFLMD